MYKNWVVLQGFLCKAPETRFLPTGGKVANASLATATFWIDAQEQQKQATEWHALVFYGSRADPAQHYCKGDNLHVEGQIQTRHYVNAQNQSKIVREIVVLSSHRIERIGTVVRDDEISEPDDADELQLDGLLVTISVSDNMPDL